MKISRRLTMCSKSGSAGGAESVGVGNARAEVCAGAGRDARTLLPARTEGTVR
jgi:hypothetical protein